MSLSPDLLNSWLFKQLRPAAVVAPLTRVVVAEREVIDENAAPEKLTEEQELQVLAHAAREYQADFPKVLGSLNNIHGRSFDDVSEAFEQRLSALVEALEIQDRDAIRSAANRLSLVIHEMQSNVPAWHYVRGLQVLVSRCLK